jgi:hypothetical protein
MRIPHLKIINFQTIYIQIVKKISKENIQAKLKLSSIEKSPYKLVDSIAKEINLNKPITNYSISNQPTSNPKANN